MCRVYSSYSSVDDQVHIGNDGPLAPPSTPSPMSSTHGTAGVLSNSRPADQEPSVPFRCHLVVFPPKYLVAHSKPAMPNYVLNFSLFREVLACNDQNQTSWYDICYIWAFIMGSQSSNIWSFLAPSVRELVSDEDISRVVHLDSIVNANV
jgi:hypothetical protein